MRLAKTSILWLLPVIAWIISCIPFLYLGYPKGHDWIFELVRVAEYRYAWEAGQGLFPFWAGNVYGGYGSPAFLFYAPLFSASAALLSYLTFDFGLASTITLAVFSGVGGVGIYLLARLCLDGRDEDGQAAARIGAVFFLLNPYLLCDKFLRNANAEFIALSLVPFALCGVMLVGRYPLKGALMIGSGLAGVLLAHNLTALVCLALILGIFIPVMILNPSIKTVRSVSGGVGLGMGLAAFFWVPAFFLRKYANMQDLVTGKFNFHNQFQSLSDVFSYEQFYAVGILPLLIFTAALGALNFGMKSAQEYKPLLSATLIMAGLFVFLITAGSVLFWENTPLMGYFQFPWRMLGPVALILSVAAALTYKILMHGRSRKLRIIVEVIIFLLCILNAIPGLIKTEPLDNLVKTNLPNILTEESIRENRLKVTVGDEYLPRAANRNAWVRKGLYARAVSDSRIRSAVTEFDGGGHQFSFYFTSPNAGLLPIGRWNFPAWTVLVNGEPVKPRSNPDGTFSVEVPRGRSRVECEYQPPVIRWQSQMLSSVAVLIFLGLTVVVLRKITTLPVKNPP